MEFLNSIKAAIKAKAPIVAIPVEGHAPLCVRQKNLKGALKGVEILTVEVTETRWLKITGRVRSTDGVYRVKTSVSIVGIDRRIAVKELSAWSEKQRISLAKKAARGDAATVRAAKLKEFEIGPEIMAANVEIADVRETVKRRFNNPHPRPAVESDVRQDCLTERLNRKERSRNSVLYYQIKLLKKDWIDLCFTFDYRTGRAKPFLPARIAVFAINLTQEIVKLKSRTTMEYHEAVCRTEPLQGRWGIYYDRESLVSILRAAKAQIAAFTPPLEEPETSLAPVVLRAMVNPIVSIGQLAESETSALTRAIRDGYLVKGKGGPYPALKTVYAPIGYDFLAARKQAIEDVLRFGG